MTFGHLWTSLAIDIARLWAGPGSPLVGESLGGVAGVDAPQFFQISIR